MEKKLSGILCICEIKPKVNFFCTFVDNEENYSRQRNWCAPKLP